MNQSDLPTVRLLARNGAFSFTNHAYKQMLNRDVSFDDVEAILISPTNQIIVRTLDYYKSIFPIPSSHHNKKLLKYRHVAHIHKGKGIDEFLIWKELIVVFFAIF